MNSISQFLIGGLFIVSVCACAKTDADAAKLVWQQTSENGVFDVTLDAQVDDSVEINQFLEWILTVKTATGEVVTPARISVGGGMRAHGHGLPTQPQISEYLGEGKYLVKGLKFNMNGNWELAFDIDAEDRKDKVVFELKIDV